jgi:hypothetical protein
MYKEVVEKKIFTFNNVIHCTKASIEGSKSLLYAAYLQRKTDIQKKFSTLGKFCNIIPEPPVENRLMFYPTKETENLLLLSGEHLFFDMINFFSDLIHSSYHKFRQS